MRSSTSLITIPAIVLLLAGCATPGDSPSSSPTPTGSATPTQTPSASPAPMLPDTSAVTAALVLPDGTKPFTSFVSTVEVDLPAFFDDLTANAAGTFTTRVACSSATGTDVAVEILPKDGAAVSFSAPCGPESAIVATDGPGFTAAVSYRVTFTSTEPAVAAIGLLPVG